MRRQARRTCPRAWAEGCATLARMPFEFAGTTDVGRRRDHNEDALLVLPQHNVAVVCDGMGGHEAGEVASGIGVETVKRFFELTGDPDSTWPFRYDHDKDEGTNLLSVAAHWANQRIRAAGEKEGLRADGSETAAVAFSAAASCRRPPAPIRCSTS